MLEPTNPIYTQVLPAFLFAGLGYLTRALMEPEPSALEDPGRRPYDWQVDG